MNIDSVNSKKRIVLTVWVKLNKYACEISEQT